MYIIRIHIQRHIYEKIAISSNDDSSTPTKDVSIGVAVKSIFLLRLYVTTPARFVYIYVNQLKLRGLWDPLRHDVDDDDDFNGGYS